MTNLYHLPVRRHIEPPAPVPTLPPETPTPELWAILWETRGETAKHRLRLRQAAEAEWNRRLELHEHEEGAGADATMRAQYDAYAAGRDAELRLRGDDIKIARHLFEAVEQALASGSLAPAQDALIALTLTERMRLRRPS